jgi:hypothetical protein
MAAAAVNSVRTAWEVLGYSKNAQRVSSASGGPGPRCGAARNTIAKLLVDLGRACAAYQDRALVDLPCKNIQCDEIWSFCYSKQKNVPDDHQGEFG